MSIFKISTFFQNSDKKRTSCYEYCYSILIQATYCTYSQATYYSTINSV